MRRFLIPLLVLAAGLIATPGTSALMFKGLVSFQTPTKNIGCGLSEDEARCDIKQHDWRTPAKPSSCHLDYGQGLQIRRRSSRGSFVCAGDTSLGSGRTLAYGASLKRGGITCTSRESSGVTCKNAKGHGFTLSRQSYKRF